MSEMEKTGGAGAARPGTTKQGGPSPFSGVRCCNQGRHYIPPQKRLGNKKYLLNAFSLSMLPTDTPVILYVISVGVEEARGLLGSDFVSAIGHESTAALLSNILGTDVKFNRTAVKLEPGDVAVVFQLLGRLPEGRVLTVDELRGVEHRFFVVEPHIHIVCPSCQELVYPPTDYRGR
jgi:hypothetical protein